MITALAAGVSLFLMRRLIRPLEILKEGAERFAQGDFSHQLPLAGGDEIGPALAQSLNQMARTLDKNTAPHPPGRRTRGDPLEHGRRRARRRFPRLLLLLNESAARLLGIDPAKSAGRMIQEAVRNRPLQELIAHVLTTHQSKEGEIVLRGQGERQLLAHGTVLRDEREEIGALVILHEVTQLKKLEKVRRDFVANVSHELRTPVTSIKGFVETLLDGAMNNPEKD